MRRLALTVTLGAAAATAAVVAIPAAASPTQPAGRHGSERVCADAPAGYAACQARVVTDSQGKPLATATPSGYGPADIRSAYNLGSSASGGRTVAIVDAYNDPTAEADLGVYRSQYGLPACTTSNGCFKKVNQTGGSSLPGTNAGWATEISLDLDMVSATCPDCKILLVEAKTASFSNLAAAVNAAAKLGATAISNSYGGTDQAALSAYEHPGIAITASTGDNGYQGGSYPASSSYVTAVGGTSLKMSGTTRVSETVWSGAGSGCSTYNTAIAAASTFSTGCAKRAMADVSAAADPNTGGLSVYAPTTTKSSSWSQYGGTSESSPIIASVYALAGGGYSNATPYAHPGSLNDITSGSNGSCPTTQWCNARSGWDGPTGLGTPNGTGAF
jgi:subtilase family serine protease